MSEMKSLTLNDKKYDSFVDQTARALVAASAVIKPASGEVISLPDSSGNKLYGLNIYGKTTQDGTPTPDAPVGLVSVGNGGSVTVNVTGEKEAQTLTVSTPNSLPGIPVDAGGNYTDVNGQQWICDEIDFERGVYIARTRKITLTGTENNISQSVLGDGVSYYRYMVGIDKQYSTNVPNSKVYDGYCSHYGRASADSAYAGKGLNKTALQFEALSFYVDIATADAFKTFLAAQYAQRTPVAVLYILATPIETPLSEAELAAYNALRTYRGTTTVSNDAGAYMELEYAMDAKKYIDSVIAGTIIPATVE